ncbi:SDR family NAD(P)-dependent oxidoreductase [Aeromicrobium sp. IC_218]|uniref:SDR family NAD(P)-dependent oxidoreductase n=1 Tax=Aeromicrobium sp. IC_218 TaxID=2545468 RepID=UPI00103B0B8F|nr:SDR family NAD(P)-dependent oxidoreductase [Aeromicrobium sp. IC_218]TCI98909.1 SDR family NAD(P)-dependent oxidoreductase [Aeromicrobium sp. IC_218]
MPRALVTGPTAGLGRAYALELARRGYDLVLVSRDQARLDALAAEIRRDHRVDVDVQAADLATSEGIDLAAGLVRSNARPVDLLVNNAGASLAGWFGTTDVADEDRQLDLLVRAPMHLSDAAIKAMTGRGGGQILNVCSVAAWTPRGAYSAHKAWLLNLTRWMSWQYADAGLQVTAVCPGFVRTEFHQRMGADVSTVPRWMWLKAPQVVRASLDDLDKGKPVSVPSLRYKVLGALARHAPAPLVARAARRGR